MKTDLLNSSSAPRDYRIEDNAPYKKMIILYGYYTEIGRGTYHSLLVIGPPGIGKSAGAREYLTRAGAKVIPLQNCNDANLADELWRYRNRRFVLFCDDNDHVWDSEGIMNKLKVVADAKGERLFVDTRKNGHGRFHVDCRFVFVTNKAVDDPKLVAFAKDMRPHIEALKSRFQLHSPLSFNRLDCYHFACWMATDGKHLLRDVRHDGRSLSIEESNQVLAWFAENFNRLKEVSVRTLIDQVADYRLKSPAIWTALAEQWCNADPYVDDKGREIKNPEPWVISKPVKKMPVEDTIEPVVEEIAPELPPVSDRPKKPAKPKVVTKKPAKKTPRKVTAKKPARTPVKKAATPKKSIRKKAV